MTARTEGLRAWLSTPVDGASLGALRALFGGVMLFATLRFWALGWIDSIYLAPEFHFTYQGFEWVSPLPAPWIYVQFTVMAGAALCLMLGVWARWSALVFCVLFTWAELIEKAAYLNHYYLVSLVAGLMVIAPCDAAFALKPGPPAARWHLLLFRAQIGLVYLYAGLAKIGSDWLFDAQPLATWLTAYGHIPVAGPVLAHPATAYVMSWAGAIFDLTIWLWLLWRPTRPWAWLVAMSFHITVWLLFPIGVFSWVMLSCATIFFAPGWPRRWLRRPARDHTPPAQTLQRISRPLLAFVMLWLGLQATLPLRHLLYPGPTNWTEEGFRFAWRVMLIEKTGQVDYRVIAQNPPGRYDVYPRRDLTPLQYKMLCTQPDFIHEYAQHIAERYQTKGHGQVAVYADAWVALNGRRPRRIVDPEADLTQWPRSQWPPAPWIQRSLDGVEE